ncbi:MAG: glutamate ABC transporter substrate-binding protein [Gordonia sp. (in: high G+C Gram-positive bacteria)]
MKLRRRAAAAATRARAPRRRTGGLFVVVATALLLTACDTDPAEAGDPPTTTAQMPTPPGVSTGYVPTGGDDQNCDMSSLRPLSPMPDPGHMPANSSMEQIYQRGSLIVGTDIGSNPLSFRDPISGDIEGFDVDVAHWISEAIFGDPDRIEFRILATDDRLKALENGEVDVVVKSMSITCKRLQSVYFSAPYYAASQRVLAYRNSGIDSVTGLTGKSTCATRGSTSIDRVKNMVPSVKVISTNSWADCLVLLQQGQVDTITSDDTILAGIAAQDPWVKMVGQSFGAEDYGVGIAKNKPDLVRFVNGVLEQRRADGSWNTSYNRWLSVLGPGSPPATTYRE